ncbi:hypothetical protein [Streptomyces chryseus]|nr:hypothetical protein [Streptomyces chryseus]
MAESCPTARFRTPRAARTDAAGRRPDCCWMPGRRAATVRVTRWSVR